MENVRHLSQRVRNCETIWWNSTTRCRNPSVPLQLCFTTACRFLLCLPALKGAFTFCVTCRERHLIDRLVSQLIEQFYCTVDGIILCRERAAVQGRWWLRRLKGIQVPPMDKLEHPLLVLRGWVNIFYLGLSFFPNSPFFPPFSYVFLSY